MTVDKLRETIKWKPQSNMRNRAVAADSRPVFNEADVSTDDPYPYGMDAVLSRHRSYPNPIKQWRKQLLPRYSSGSSARRVPIPSNSPGSTSTVNGPPVGHPAESLCSVAGKINVGAPPPNNNNANVFKPNLAFYTGKHKAPKKPLYLHGPGYPGHNGRPCCSPESNIIPPTAGMATKRINPIQVINDDKDAPYLTNGYSFDTSGYLRSKGKSFNTRVAGTKKHTEDIWSKSLYSSQLGNNVRKKDGRTVRSECCDVMVKPSNKQFFTQGAVSSSSRIARLKYNTLTSKSYDSSFTTAWAVAADNAGIYRTNGNGPYFMKNKATVCQAQDYARFNKVCGRNKQ